MEPYHLGMAHKWPVEGSCTSAAPAVPEGDVVVVVGGMGVGGGTQVLVGAGLFCQGLSLLRLEARHGSF